MGFLLLIMKRADTDGMSALGPSLNPELNRH